MIMSSEGLNSRGFIEEEDEFDRNLNINDPCFHLREDFARFSIIEISAMSRFFPV